MQGSEYVPSIFSSREKTVFNDSFTQKPYRIQTIEESIKSAWCEFIIVLSICSMLDKMSVGKMFSQIGMDVANFKLVGIIPIARDILNCVHHWFTCIVLEKFQEFGRYTVRTIHFLRLLMRCKMKFSVEGLTKYTVENQDCKEVMCKEYSIIVNVNSDT